jgi:glucosamine-6-phosphate deaminase
MVSFAPLAPPDERQVEKLHVETFPSRQALGVAAAEDIATELRTRLARQDKVRMVFAAAPSQSEVLAALVAAKDVDWTRVEAFHMDDYIGLPESAPERFANWLDRNIFDHLPFAAVHHISPGHDVDETVRNYEALLRQAPIDVIQLGIGVNGHIAFNDPPVADFNDPTYVKVVELDLACRQQQVNCTLYLDRESDPNV